MLYTIALVPVMIYFLIKHIVILDSMMLFCSASVAKCHPAPNAKTDSTVLHTNVVCTDPFGDTRLLATPHRATVSSGSRWAYRVCPRAFLEKHCLFCLPLSLSVPCLPRVHVNNDPQRPIVCQSFRSLRQSGVASSATTTLHRRRTFFLLRAICVHGDSCGTLRAQSVVRGKQGRGR